jgi:RND family efflux transporter MFP subunit
MRRIALVALAAAGLAFAAQANPPLETAKAEYREQPRRHLLDGVVEAVHQSTISAQTKGQIEEILFDVDDFVEKGQVIIRLKSREQQAGLNEAQAAVTEAAARLLEARQEQERMAKIYAKKLVARAALDKADAALKAAIAHHDAARAALAKAQEQVEYTLVRAPYSGIVTERHVHEGEIANPGQKLMTGISLDQLRVNVDIPQSLIQAVREQHKGSIQLPDGSWIEAKKLTISPYAHHGSNTFKVRLDLPAGTPHLFPGMYVKCAFVVGSRKALLIPQQAVVHRGEVTGAYVAAPDGRISLRYLRVGQPNTDGMIEVLAGLDAGERVALDPIAAGTRLKAQPVEQPHG